jgi:putative FmdB family regulatory protein
MPTYGYFCETCGPFDALRPMAEHDRPLDCPRCGDAAPRAFPTAPRLATMDGARRTAFATNERSAHAPKRSGAVTNEACRLHGHDGGGHKAKNGRAVYRADGSKTFPSARPWMISH